MEPCFSVNYCIEKPWPGSLRSDFSQISKSREKFSVRIFYIRFLESRNIPSAWILFSQPIHYRCYPLIDLSLSHLFHNYFVYLPDASHEVKSDEFWDYEQQVDLEAFSCNEFYSILSKQSRDVTSSIARQKDQVNCLICFWQIYFYFNFVIPI